MFFSIIKHQQKSTRTAKMSSHGSSRSLIPACSSRSGAPPQQFGAATVIAHGINILVGPAGQVETLRLGTRIRMQADNSVLAHPQLVDGSHFTNAPPKAMKAIFAHLSGDENFNEILEGRCIMLGVVQTWILAGQLGLYNVQNRLISRLRDVYKDKYVNHIKDRIDPDAFDWIEKQFGRDGTSKIEQFLVCWYAGLLGSLDIIVNSDELRASTRDRLCSVSRAIRVRDRDQIKYRIEQFKVGDQGASVHAIDLMIEIPNGPMTNIGSSRKSITSGRGGSHANPSSSTTTIRSTVLLPSANQAGGSLPLPLPISSPRPRMSTSTRFPTADMNMAGIPMPPSSPRPRMSSSSRSQTADMNMAGMPMPPSPRAFPSRHITNAVPRSPTVDSPQGRSLLKSALGRLAANNESHRLHTSHRESRHVPLSHHESRHAPLSHHESRHAPPGHHESRHGRSQLSPRPRMMDESPNATAVCASALQGPSRTRIQTTGLETKISRR